MNYKYISLSVLLLMSVTMGCNDLLEPEIKGQIALDKLVETESGMITAINGVYQPLVPMYSGPMQRITDLASDDGWTWRNELEPDLFAVEPVFGHSQTVWINAYRGITRANTVLDNLDKVTNYSSNTVKNNIAGQAKFLRAFYYFHLVRLYGGVPLVVKEVKSREDAELPRASIPDVYAQIKTDLTEAEQLLPESFTGGNGTETGRADRLAAIGLQALVALELEDWANAASLAAKLAGKKELLTNYAANFNGTAENGKGSVFELQFGGVDASNTSTISTFYAPTSTPSGSALILPTDDNLGGKGGGPSSGGGIMQEYTENDLRKKANFDTYGIANFVDASKPAGSLYYVHKFYNTTNPISRSTWNIPLIRYAEILLTRAEALNESGTTAEAIQVLNSIRTVAGLEPYTPAQLSSQSLIREAIRKERRLELAFETKRYFDLNRWGILENRIQPQLAFLGLKFPSHRTIVHPVTGKKYYLYPLPSTEFTNNAYLGEQNPGYN